MLDTETFFDALQKSVQASPANHVKFVHFEPIFTRVAAGYLDDNTRPVAELLMKDWASGTDPLAKGLAQHWLDRAHATVEGGMAAGKAVGGRKIHPMIERLRAQQKGARPLRKFDESKVKRDKTGEFSGDAAAGATRAVASAHGATYEHHAAAALAATHPAAAAFHTAQAETHLEASTQMHAAADKAGEPKAAPAEPVDTRSLFGQFRDFSRRMSAMGSGAGIGAGIGALTGNPLAIAGGALAGGYAGYKAARLTE
jgi:hypothetical protein